MAGTVINLLDDTHERQRMSEKSREQALKFSWFDVMKQLETVYSAIA
jgi:glycosyltransferase involved in cell wall biosynthesis